MKTTQRTPMVTVVFLAAALLACQSLPPGTNPTATAPAPAPSPTPPSAATLAATATEPATATSAATLAPTDTSAAPASETPELGLQTSGPYLTYWVTTDDQVTLVRLDADGRGRAALDFPAEGPHPAQNSGLAPTGEWVAAFTGDDPACFAEAVPAAAPDWRLQLVHVPDGAVRDVTPLFGPDFVTQFAAAAATLDPSAFGGASLEQIQLTTWGALVCGVKKVAWSPDGRTLAFAAALDGGSSDLYFYDVATEAITRQSDGPEQIDSLSWSPDGQCLGYTSTNAIGEGMEYNFHAVALDGHASWSNVTHSQGVNTIAWAAPEIFVTDSAANGPGEFDLRTVNVATGATSQICPDSVWSWAVDAARGLVAAACTQGGGADATWVLFDGRTGSQTNVAVPLGDEGLPMLGFWGIGEARFALGEWDGAYYVHSLIAADGSVTPWQSDGQDYLSPERNYRATAGGDALTVYTAAGEVVRTVDTAALGPVKNVFWRPDEQGLFFFDGDYQLYALDLAAGEPRLVEDWAAASSFTSPQWVSP